MDTTEEKRHGIAIVCVVIACIALFCGYYKVCVPHYSFGEIQTEKAEAKWLTNPKGGYDYIRVVTDKGVVLTCEKNECPGSIRFSRNTNKVMVSYTHDQVEWLTKMEERDTILSIIPIHLTDD